MNLKFKGRLAPQRAKREKIIDKGVSYGDVDENRL